MWIQLFPPLKISVMRNIRLDIVFLFELQSPLLLGAPEDVVDVSVESMSNLKIHLTFTCYSGWITSRRCFVIDK